MNDPINPQHYKSHPSGIECITVTEHFNFCLGNAIKYIWRSAEKGNTLEDLKKARWYLDREISRLSKAKGDDWSDADRQRINSVYREIGRLSQKLAKR
jgi:hypothetical protein